MSKNWFQNYFKRTSSEFLFTITERPVSAWITVFWPSFMVSQLLHVSVSKDRMQFYAWGDGINSRHLWNSKYFPNCHSTSLQYHNENTALCCHIHLTAVIKTNIIFGYMLFQIWALYIMNTSSSNSNIVVVFVDIMNYDIILCGIVNIKK